MSIAFEEPDTTVETTVETTADGPARLRLTLIGAGEWLIHDERFGRHDPRCLVAFVREEADADLDVVWLGPVSPAGRYRTTKEVLAAAVAAST